MKAATENRFLVLMPFDPAEGICLSQAAHRAGKSSRTIRNWCEQFGLGRRVGGGVWVVSQVALAMFLEDDQVSLAAYLAGDRESFSVVRYFQRFNLSLQMSLAVTHIR